jgi:hypothetical protein
MRRSIPLLLALALLAAGCDRGGERNAEQDRALAGRALRGVLAYPQSSLVSLSAGTEAAELAFSSPAAVAEVAQWYRQALPLNGWELRSDQTGRDGTVSMYAEQGSRPLWLTLRPNVGGPGTSYTMVGAVVEPDSAKAK